MIQTGDLLASVDQERKWEIIFRAELRVACRPLRIHAEDLDAARERYAPVLPELAELLASARRVVPGIKHEHDLFAA